MFVISRVTKDPLVRQTEILDAAQELFLSVGYQQTNVQDIVRKVQVAQGTFYYYFPSKEAVLEAIAVRDAKDMTAQLHASLPPDASILEQLQLFVNLLYRLSYSGQLGRLAKVLYREKQGELIHSIWRKTQSIVIPHLISLLEEGNRSGITTVAKIPEAIAFFIGIIATLLESISPAEFGHEHDPQIIANKIEIAERLIVTLFGLPENSLSLQRPSLSVD